MDEKLKLLFPVTKLTCPKNTSSYGIHSGEISPEEFITAFMGPCSPVSAKDIAEGPHCYAATYDAKTLQMFDFSVGVAIPFRRIPCNRHIPEGYVPRISVAYLTRRGEVIHSVNYWMPTKPISMKIKLC